jgi:hypothetical protein
MLVWQISYYVASRRYDFYYVFSVVLYLRISSYKYTLIWFLRCVNSLVLFQIGCSGEDLTHIKHIMLLSGVSFLMFQQVAPAPEPQLTTLANIISFLIVPVHVRQWYSCAITQCCVLKSRTLYY